MRLPRPVRSAFAVVVGVPTLAALTFAFAEWGRAQPSTAGSAERIGVAEYDADGRLVFPDGADRWITVGASIGSDYDEQTFDPANAGPIGVVQIEPAAYDYFQANGRYADGTMLLLTFYAVQEKPEPALNGFVQGDVLQREIHVIDRERFAEEGRAFFVFAPGQSAAPALAQGSVCVECHTAHGDLDATFVQFYPALR